MHLNFGDGTAISWLLGLLVPTIVMAVLTRCGLLALMTAFFFIHVWAFFPGTTELSAWYARTYVLQLAVLSALVAFAFRTALAGQKVFNDTFLNE